MNLSVPDKVYSGNASCVLNLISTFLFIHLFQKLSFPCNELKIEVDQTVADEWIELDAVEVIGSVTGMYLLISEIYICHGN